MKKHSSCPPAFRHDDGTLSKLASTLVFEMQSGIYPPGSLLPKETELAKTHGCGLVAVRKVCNWLADRGYVKRIRRKGTVVLPMANWHSMEKVALFFPNNSPAYQMLSEAAGMVLSKVGCAYFKQLHEDEPEKFQELLKASLTAGVEGLLIAPPHPFVPGELKQLTMEGFPIVVVGYQAPTISSVYPDNLATGQLVAEHFANLGRKIPAMIYRNKLSGQLRLQGFRQGLEERGIALRDTHVLPLQHIDTPYPPPEDFGRGLATWILSLDPQPDCVFVFNDFYAGAAYYWLRRMGVEIPQRIAIAGVDNEGSHFLPFQITSVEIGLMEIGHRAAELLLEISRRPAMSAVHICIQPRLVVRSSTVEQNSSFQKS